MNLSSDHPIDKMLGVLYSSTFDFSVFSNPRPCHSSGICCENHVTAIEERYCLKEHPRELTDQEWDAMLAHEMQLFAESEPDLLSYHGTSSDALEPTMNDVIKNSAYVQEDLRQLEVPPPTPASVTSMHSTPSLVTDNDTEDSFSVDCHDSDSNDMDYEVPLAQGKRASSPALSYQASISRKRKKGKTPKPYAARKRLCRADSSTSVSTTSSMASSGSMALAMLPSMMIDSENPWKCPHCPWVQTTKRLPDFLRHQRSHFVSQSDWPCPNPKCGKGFARKDSLKRHLDNRSTGCTRPPGYTVC